MNRNESISLLSTREIAHFLGVHPKHVYRLLKRGLPARRVGGAWRFDRNEVAAWTRSRTGTAGTTGTPKPAPSALPSILAANGDLAVEALLVILARTGPPFLGMMPADRGTALECLMKGQVLAAGYHGEPGPALDPRTPMVRVHLVRREIGLAARSPRHLPAVEDLGSVRLASRPPSAGIRVHLDEAIRSSGGDPDAVHEGALLLPSHREVVASLARERADVGITTQAWARRLGLAFSPLTWETYGILAPANALADPRMGRVVEVATSRTFRSVVESFGGYDLDGAGEITLEEIPA